jgi:23S rRNA (cytidine2498-2'-O)-methyltransferase
VTDILITCKEHYEKILGREMKLYGLHLKEKGQGWILAQGDKEVLLSLHDASAIDLCFANTIHENPILISATSVNSFAEKLIELFIAQIGQTRIVDPWAFLFSSSGTEQLIHRVKTIQACWFTKLSKKMSRVAKLSQEGIPHSAAFTEGFFVHMVDFNQAFVSFKALSNGQQRMQMDPKAPSRSYLKIEEAFRIFGCEPQENETVIDLGASPGGWSYSALKRGATVTAIDNGPLKEPVKSHPNICHLRADAFTYRYEYGKPVDWLLCDIIDHPEIILDLLHQWLDQGWCRYFIVNLKLGRLDPIMLLKEIRDPQTGLVPFCASLSVRQLYHDREEITLMGQVKE